LIDSRTGKPAEMVAESIVAAARAAQMASDAGVVDAGRADGGGAASRR